MKFATHFRNSICVVSAGLVWGTSAAATSTPPTFGLEVRGEGFRRITVQIATAQADAAAQGFQRDISEAQETLARDLIFTGFFFVMDAGSGPYLPRGVSRAWNAANERPGERPFRCESQWSVEAGRLVIDLRLMDGAGAQIVGKRYTAAASGLRPVMHHFADQIVHALTGLPGIAQTQIAFARLQGKQSEIWTVDYDGLGEKQVTQQRSLTMSPCWGGDRGWIAFTSWVEGQPRLYRVDQGSRQLRAVSTHPGLNSSPEWSEARGAFAVTLTRDGNAEIYSMDREGRSLKRLTHQPAIDTSPTWSADGREIAFTSDRSGVPQIYVMDADGGNVRRITRHGLYSDSAAWSPDGQWIAYVCRRDGEFQLTAMRPDGSDERVVVRDGLNDTPSWANDSRHLAFSSRRGGSRAVYVVDVYSGLERRLSSGYEEAITPAWSSR